MPWSCLKKKTFQTIYIYHHKVCFCKRCVALFVSKIGLDSSICSLYMYDKRGVYEDMSQAVSYMCTCIQIKLMFCFFNVMIFLGINCFAWIYLFMLFLIIILWNYYLLEAVKFIGECIHRIKRVCLPQNTVDYLIFDGALKSTVIFFEKFWLKKFLISSCNLLDKFLIWNFNFLVDFILHKLLIKHWCYFFRRVFDNQYLSYN